MPETGGYTPEEMYQRFKDGLTTPDEDIVYREEHAVELYDEADAMNQRRIHEAVVREHEPDTVLADLDREAAQRAAEESRRVYGGGLTDRQLQDEANRTRPDEPRPN